MSRKIPSNFKIILSFTILFLILLTTYRVSFTIVFLSKFYSVSFFEIILAFLVGIRFDLSVCAILIGPFWIFSSIYPLNRFRTYSLFWGISPIVLFFWAVSHLIGDVLYFGETNKHLGYEGFIFLGTEFWIIFKAFFVGHTILAIISCLLIGTLLPFTIYQYIQKKLYVYDPAQKNQSYYNFLLLFQFYFCSCEVGFNPDRSVRATQ